MVLGAGEVVVPRGRARSRTGASAGQKGCDVAEATRNELLIKEFRANHGVVFEPDKPPRTLLLLTTRGRRSGAAHTTPLVCIAEGARYLVFATHGGSPEDPDWFLNLVAAGTATVEVGAESFRAKATVLEGEERDRRYDEQAARFPPFAQYALNTARVIPVVALERID